MMLEMLAMKRKYTVTLEIEIEGDWDHPRNWDWEELIGLEYNENVRVISSV